MTTGTTEIVKRYLVGSINNDAAHGDMDSCISADTEENIYMSPCDTAYILKGVLSWVKIRKNPRIKPQNKK
jgi:hypothetical protein